MRKVLFANFKRNPHLNSLPEPEHSDEYRSLALILDRLNPGDQPKIAWTHRAIQRIRGEKRRLGIFSGSFNPLTIAHVSMIDQAQAEFNLEEILLLLAKTNVDKSVFGFSLPDRLLMLRAYCAGRDNFSVAACSHGRYIDKVKALNMAYPPSTGYSFVIGYDTLVRLFDAKYYTHMHEDLQLLFNQSRFITANREKHDGTAIEKLLAGPTCKRYASNIDMIRLPKSHADISSTAIRKRLLRQAPIDHLVPGPIADHIKATKLQLAESKQ